MRIAFSIKTIKIVNTLYKTEKMTNSQVLDLLTKLNF